MSMDENSEAAHRNPQRGGAQGVALLVFALLVAFGLFRWLSDGSGSLVDLHQDPSFLGGRWALNAVSEGEPLNPKRHRAWRAVFIKDVSTSDGLIHAAITIGSDSAVLTMGFAGSKEVSTVLQFEKPPGPSVQSLLDEGGVSISVRRESSGWFTHDDVLVLEIGDAVRLLKYRRVIPLID